MTSVQVSDPVAISKTTGTSTCSITPTGCNDTYTTGTTGDSATVSNATRTGTTGQSNASSTMIPCMGCQLLFVSKNKMFKHLLETNGLCIKTNCSEEEYANFKKYVKNQPNKREKFIILYGYMLKQPQQQQFQQLCSTINSSHMDIEDNMKECTSTKEKEYDGNDVAELLLHVMEEVSVPEIEYRMLVEKKKKNDSNSKNNINNNNNSYNYHKINRSYGHTSRNTTLLRQEYSTSAVTELLTVQLPSLHTTDTIDTTVARTNNSSSTDGNVEVFKSDVKQASNVLNEKWIQNVNDVLQQHISIDHSSWVIDIIVFGRQPVQHLKKFNPEVDFSHRRMEYIIPADFFYPPCNHKRYSYRTTNGTATDSSSYSNTTTGTDRDTSNTNISTTSTSKGTDAKQNSLSMFDFFTEFPCFDDSVGANTNNNKNNQNRHNYSNKKQSEGIKLTTGSTNTWNSTSQDEIARQQQQQQQQQQLEDSTVVNSDLQNSIDGIYDTSKIYNNNKSKIVNNSTYQKYSFPRPSPDTLRMLWEWKRCMQSLTTNSYEAVDNESTLVSPLIVDNDNNEKANITLITMDEGDCTGFDSSCVTSQTSEIPNATTDQMSNKKSSNNNNMDIEKKNKKSRRGMAKEIQKQRQQKLTVDSNNTQIESIDGTIDGIKSNDNLIITDVSTNKQEDNDDNTTEPLKKRNKNGNDITDTATTTSSTKKKNVFGPTMSKKKDKKNIRNHLSNITTTPGKEQSTFLYTTGVKRRRYHNFTPTAMAHEYTSQRRVDRFYHRATIRLQHDKTQVQLLEKQNEEKSFLAPSSLFGTDRPYLVLSVSGDMFLTEQVRRLVGLFVAIARGVIDPDIVQCVFDEKYPHLIPTPPVPVIGLYATDVYYMTMEGKLKSILTPRISNRYTDGWNTATIVQNVYNFQDRIRRYAASKWESYDSSSLQCESSSTGRRLSLEEEWTEQILNPWAERAQKQLQDYRNWKKALFRQGNISPHIPPVLRLSNVTKTTHVNSDQLVNVGENSNSNNTMTTDPSSQEKEMDSLTEIGYALETIDPSVPALFDKVLFYLRQVDSSGKWPSTTPKRQLVMVSNRMNSNIEEWNSGETNSSVDKTGSTNVPGVVHGETPMAEAAIRARANVRVENDSAYIYEEGQGGASGSFSVGAMPGGNCMQPKSNKIFPELMKAAFELEIALCPHREPSSTIAINRNAQFRPHTDSGAGAGQSTSLIVGLGTYGGGELVVEGDTVDIRYKAIEFNGWKQRHWTMPFHGERYSLVWFTPKGCEGVHGIDLCK